MMDRFCLRIGLGFKTIFAAILIGSIFLAPTFGFVNILPYDGNTFYGGIGGPFTPASKALTLWNYGTVPVTWSAAGSQPWITLDVTSGVLAVDAPSTLNLTINDSAKAFSLGTYSGDFVFTDVTNGGVQIQTVTLYIIAPPVITTQPTDIRVTQGDLLTISCYCESFGPPTYQWYRNGEAIPGATTAQYTVYGARLQDAGTYRQGATNAAGTTFSQEITVDVTPATFPSFLIHPQNQATYVGVPAKITASATGVPAPTYEWYADGSLLSQAGNFINYTLSAPGEVTISVKATNVAGSVTSNSAKLKVYARDSGQVIGLSPLSRTVGCGRVAYPLTVRSNSEWTVTKSANWVSLSANSGIFEGSVEVTVAPNPLPVERSATITVGNQIHTLVQRATGTPISELWTVGYSSFAQLTSLTFPGLSDTDVKDIAANADQSLYIKNDGTLWANVLIKPSGIFYADDYATIPIASGVVAMSCGNEHTMFIKTDGTLWATGGNYYGQLGDGTTTNRTVPLQVATNVQSVSCGDEYTMFVKTDGSLWGVGRNGLGQLGDGTITARTIPVQIASNVQSVACGSSHTLFIKPDGTLWVCGYNLYGQLGNGTYSDHQSSPVQVATNARNVVGCGDSSFMFKNDGSL